MFDSTVPTEEHVARSGTPFGAFAFYLDHTHLSGLGNKLVARQISDKLVDLMVIERE